MIDRRLFLKGIAALSTVVLLPSALFRKSNVVQIPKNPYELQRISMIVNGRTVTWPKNIVWSQSHEPALTTGVDIVEMVRIGDKWYATYIVGLS